MHNLAITLLIFWAVSVSSKNEQLSTCDLCREVMTALIQQVGGSVSEQSMSTYLKLGCTTLGLDSWCTKNLYGNIHDIFLALQNNKTDDVICERLALCHFRVVSITGDILFADRDILYTIRELPHMRLQHDYFGTVGHPSMPNGIVSGLACSVDYCAVLLKQSNADGTTTYGTTAISIMNQIHQPLSTGIWYGPWFDLVTEQFWMATGKATKYTFGTFDPSRGNWEPRLDMNYHDVGEESQILSGQILDHILYLTFLHNPQVYLFDLTLRIPRGSFPCPNNTMLVGNPVTNILYGYAPSKDGIYILNNGNITQVVNIDISGAEPVQSATINSVDESLWISLWGSANDAWMRVDLTKTVDNVAWAPTGNLMGLFDFNPYKIESVEVD